MGGEARGRALLSSGVGTFDGIEDRGAAGGGRAGLGGAEGASYGGACSSRSNGVGGTNAQAQALEPHPASRCLVGCIFGFFVLSRSLHSLIIEWSKVPTNPDGTGGRFLHEPVSVPLVECILTLVLAQAIALTDGGLARWRSIWLPAPMRVFSAIGFVYAFGDYFELKSMSRLSGTAYQVMMQSKAIVTAVLLHFVKGQNQTKLQWILLTLLMLAMSCHMIMKDLLRQHRNGVPEAEIGIDRPSLAPEGVNSSATDASVGVMMAMAKVGISSLCAVLSDKYMKDFRDEPIYVQIAQFKVAWTVSLVLLAVLDGFSWERGLFHDWSPAVVGGLISYMATDWNTMYLLAIMDSLMKNMGEACTVLLTYFIAVMHPDIQDRYELETFATVLVVFVAVIAYLRSKSVVAKALKYDEEFGSKSVAGSTPASSPRSPQLRVAA